MSEQHSVDEAIARVRQGDVEAYAGVVQAEADFLLAWLAPRCPPGLDPEELSQRAFVVAYEHLDSYHPGTRFRSWLCGIARNQLLSACRDLRRRRQHERSCGDLQQLQHLDQRCMDQDFAAAEDFRLPALRRCLGQLSPTAQELLQLRYGQGLSPQALAQRLGRSVSAVGKSLSLLRRRLRHCIAQGAVATSAADELTTPGWLAEDEESGAAGLGGGADAALPASAAAYAQGETA